MESWFASPTNYLEVAVVFGILIGATLLFISGKIAVEVTALAVMVMLMATHVLSPMDGLSGFSNQATLTIAAMLSLSFILERTGAISMVMRPLFTYIQSPFLLLFLLFLIIIFFSAFINNTAVVAVMLPILLHMSEKMQMSPSRLLIPLSYASQVGGVCTLIGTSSNLIVNSIAVEAGLEPITLFEMGQLGVFLIGTLFFYFILFGKYLLPDRGSPQLTEMYHLENFVTELRVLEGSKLIGQSPRKKDLFEKSAIFVLKLNRGEKTFSPYEIHEIQEGDVLLVKGNMKEVMDYKDGAKLTLEPNFKLQDESLRAQDLALVQVFISPISRLVDRSLKQIDFHRRYRIVVLAIQRRGRIWHETLSDIPLMAGDALLLEGKKEDIEILRKNDNFILIDKLLPIHSTSRYTAWISITVFILALILASLNVYPIVVTTIAAVVILMLLRFVTLSQLTERIDWRVIILLIGILPLSIALTKSGAADLLTSSLLNISTTYSPFVILGFLYIATSLLTEMMTNVAAAAILTPIAITLATQLGVHPKPFLLSIAFAASTSFSTPIGYQTNMMVYTAGDYTYADFLRVGIPLNFLFAILSIVMIPKIWPF